MHSRSTVLAIMLLALLSAATLGGCSDPKAKAAGTYDVDKVALKAAAQAHVKAKGENSPEGQNAAMMAGMIDAMSITLTLNADGTASMISAMMGQSQTATGTWTISGSAITITASKAGEAPETVTGTVSGDTITLKPPKGEDMPFDLVMKKRKG